MHKITSTLGHRLSMASLHICGSSGSKSGSDGEMGAASSSRVWLSVSTTSSSAKQEDGAVGKRSGSMSGMNLTSQPAIPIEESRRIETSRGRLAVRLEDFKKQSPRRHCIPGSPGRFQFKHHASRDGRLARTSRSNSEIAAFSISVSHSQSLSSNLALDGPIISSINITRWLYLQPSS